MQIERLDHHGIVAGVIDDLGIVDMLDEMLGTDEQEEISMGDAVKGMIINGLGFSDKPVSLTPLFFEQLPVEALFRPGVKGEHFNRHKLGRALDALHAYGCDTAFSRIAVQTCQMESASVPISMRQSSAILSSSRPTSTSPRSSMDSVFSRIRSSLSAPCF